MLWDAFHEDDEQGEEAQDAKLDLKELIMLAIATSIDALAVGITFAFLQVAIVPSVAIIGVVTPDVPIWDGGKAGIEECTYEAASTAVKEAIQAINGQADVIVVSATWVSTPSLMRKAALTPPEDPRRQPGSGCPAGGTQPCGRQAERGQCGHRRCAQQRP